jgi:hypothetical protein
MKLIEVQYVEESSKAIFFNVAFEIKETFWHEGKVIIKRAFLEKWQFGTYSNNFQWSDNSKNLDKFNEVFIQEMILKYEQRQN